MQLSPADLVASYDGAWSRTDFDALARLWVRSDPDPVYIGDEYAEPQVGADALDRHWGRLSARVRSASMRSEVRRADVLDGGVVRCVLLSRWRLTTRGPGGAGDGASWVSWLLVPRAEGLRIAMHMESEIHVPE